MQLKFNQENEYCTGCKACQQACKDAHSLQVGINLRRVISKETIDDNQNIKVNYRSTSCNHCNKPMCIERCPVNAIIKRVKDGVVIINEEKCIGCGECANACPYKSIQIQQQTRKAIKCDMCVGLLNEGKNPLCIDACPLHLLSIKCVD
ncbi:4Fe-4S dicluster domain-containing protein [Clostridium saccharobutylicum]|uniref:Anaerobic dimethyl sulfoxide reductase chain B n=1 Tax=Clostridium saccharobutylicum TaxID=169679 RepID=A0A1S8NIR7_CLOSA|nr:4Fe-4S dicluster domain-containing protein [Clostridium saccharobutylicum]OOM16340.1 anaerobic dimethyl sulfoxide reductase chain B [Clostridium saccharobutylicum]